MADSAKSNGILSRNSVYCFIYSYHICVIRLLVFLSCLTFVSSGSAQNATENGQNNSGRQTGSSSSTNFDGRMLAGLNGDSMYSFSMTQGMQGFAYQLNSSLSNNNDFNDYSNTSFNTHETGFTGELTLFDNWKIIPEFEITNSSYGMYDNQYYSRESRDKIRLRLKNEYKPVPDRWEFDLNYARYDHGLTKTDNSVKEDTFHTMKGIAGMEYIWSASNKFGIRSENGLNRYPDEYKVKDDSYSYNEIYVGFKITEYTMLTLTPMLCWNADGTDYFYYKSNISTINIKYLSIELLHEHKLSPYRPEELMFSQKFMSALYNLPPSDIYRTELKCALDVETGAGANAFFGVKKAGLRLRGVYEDNNNFYNYYPTSERLLSAESIPVNFFNGKAEFVTTLILFTQLIDMEFTSDNYRYLPQGSYKNVNVTYRSARSFTCNISYEGKWLEINWTNSYRKDVYVEPGSSRKLPDSVLGTLDVHIRLYDTLYLHSRIINLYNEEYNYRDGYPEPGVQFFTGLRVII